MSGTNWWKLNAVCPGGIKTEISSGEFMKDINKTGIARAMADIGANPCTGIGD